MTTRRGFLRSLALTAAGVYVAGDVMEELLEPRRKLWAGADFGGEWYGPSIHELVQKHYVKVLREHLRAQSNILEALQHLSPPRTPLAGRALTFPTG